MSSKLNAMLLFLCVFLLVCSCVFADGNSSASTLRWSYVLNREVAENVSPFFTTPDREKVESVSLDFSSGLTLSEAQVFLGVSTNRVSGFSLKLVFFPMHNAQNSQDSKLYPYDARVYSGTDGDSSILGDISANTSEGKSVVFVGRTAYSADYPTQHFYPISLSLNPYLDEYLDGTYEGTITIEVVIET